MRRHIVFHESMFGCHLFCSSLGEVEEGNHRAAEGTRNLPLFRHPEGEGTNTDPANPPPHQKYSKRTGFAPNDWCFHRATGARRGYALSDLLVPMGGKERKATGREDSDRNNRVEVPPCGSLTRTGAVHLLPVRNAGEVEGNSGGRCILQQDWGAYRERTRSWIEANERVIFQVRCTRTVPIPNLDWHYQCFVDRHVQAQTDHDH